MLVDLAQTAERAGVDFVSLDDGFDPAPDRPDALLAMAGIAPATTSIGLVRDDHRDPHRAVPRVEERGDASTSSPTGRAGWRVAVSTSEAAAKRFGRKDPQPLDELYAEADDAIEVVRRLWDSWEDDAVIRDQPTGRYLDRDKVHYIDFEGPFFNVRGPSITPALPAGPLADLRRRSTTSPRARWPRSEPMSCSSTRRRTSRPRRRSS